MKDRSIGPWSHRVRVMLVAAMVLASLGSTVDTSLGAKRRNRSAMGTYAGAGAAAPLVPVDRRLCTGSATLGCMTFPTRPRESYVRVKVTDASNTGAVLAVVAQDLNGDYWFEANEVWMAFCGESHRMRIRRGTDVAVIVYEASVGATGVYGGTLFLPYIHRCDGVATTGTVEAIFSRPAGR